MRIEDVMELYAFQGTCTPLRGKASILMSTAVTWVFGGLPIRSY
jgi:hypothetical protein